MQHFTKWIVFSYETCRNTKAKLMQSKHHSRKPWPVILILAFFALTAIAWVGGGGWQQSRPAPRVDSVPHIKHTPVKKKKIVVEVDGDINVEPDLDNIHIELDGLHENLEAIDWDQIDREIERSTQTILDSINIPEIDLPDVEVNIKDIDVEQIEKEVQETVQQAIKSIDLKEIDAEVRTSLDELNIELHDGDVHRNIREERDMASHSALLDQLEEDGLINPEKDFELEFKDKNLYINGEKQSPQTTERYRRYFRNGHTRLLYKNGRFTSR
jgi:hypothetical protein